MCPIRGPEVRVRWPACPSWRAGLATPPHVLSYTAVRRYIRANFICAQGFGNNKGAGGHRRHARRRDRCLIVTSTLTSLMRWTRRRFANAWLEVLGSLITSPPFQITVTLIAHHILNEPTRSLTNEQAGGRNGFNSNAPECGR